MPREMPCQGDAVPGIFPPARCLSEPVRETAEMHARTAEMQLVALHWEPTWLADFLAFDKLTLQSYLPRLPSLQALLQAERPSRCKINDNFGSIMKGNWQLQREGLEQRFQESLQGCNMGPRFVRALGCFFLWRQPPVSPGCRRKGWLGGSAG